MHLKSMNITFIISAMDAGGAQRVISLMANHWAAAGHTVTLLTVSDTPSFYVLNPKVTLIGLGLQREPGSLFSGLKANIKRVRTVRKTLQTLTPDMVISFLTQTNILAAIACRSLKLPIIISERINPEKAEISAIWKKARPIIYKRADALVVQTRHARDVFKAAELDAVIISNPIKPLHLSPGKKENRVLAAGRLTHQKGFDLLIKAFSETSAADWQLTILGDGPEKDHLAGLIKRLNQENRICLAGQTENIDDFFSTASIFVLSSRFEGFPNVLCEAMAAGLACISFDCDAGPSEIIDHNTNGLLVKNSSPKELTFALDRLMADAEKRAALGHEAAKLSERLRLDKIMRQWEDTINQILNR